MGIAEGDSLAVTLGCDDGEMLGRDDGARLGATDGGSLGDEVGRPEVVGSSLPVVGTVEGDAEGAFDGTTLGTWLGALDVETFGA